MHTLSYVKDHHSGTNRQDILSLVKVLLIGQWAEIVIVIDLNSSLKFIAEDLRNKTKYFSVHLIVCDNF